MARLPWFRMYHEARSDRKLATLNDREHRLWFNLLCLASEQSDRGEIPTTADYLLALEIGADDGAEVIALIEKLARLHMVSRNVTPGHAETFEVGVTFVHFQDRQYDKPSDLPEATRARKAKQRDIERQSRDVTPSHAQEEKRVEEKRVEREEAAASSGGTGGMPPSPPSIYVDTLDGALPALESLFQDVDKQFNAGWLAKELAAAAALVGPLSREQLGQGLDLALKQLKRQMDAGKVTSPRPFAHRLIVDFLTEQRDEHHAA